MANLDLAPTRMIDSTTMDTTLSPREEEKMGLDKLLDHTLHQSCEGLRTKLHLLCDALGVSTYLYSIARAADPPQALHSFSRARASAGHQR